MLCKVTDPRGKNGNLDFRRSGILGILAELFDELELLVLRNHWV